jgi:hypothetical protein
MRCLKAQPLMQVLLACGMMEAAYHNLPRNWTDGQIPNAPAHLRLEHYQR